MKVNNLSQAQLLVMLRDMAKEWSNKRGLCHDYSEGVRYGEIQEALKKHGVSARIDTVDHHDDMQVIIDEPEATQSISITVQEAVHLMKVTINHNYQLEEINDDLVTNALREYRAINGAFDTLMGNVREGKENLMDGIIESE